MAFSMAACVLQRAGYGHDTRSPGSRASRVRAMEIGCESQPELRLIAHNAAPRDEDCTMSRRRSCRRGIAILIALTALVAACSKPTPTTPKPPYPYGIPTASDADMTELEVVRAYDGSLLEVRFPGRADSFDLNLGGVMAPTPAQPWGGKATEALQRTTAGKHAWVWKLDFDSYRDLTAATHRRFAIGTVYVEGVDIAWEMVGNGNAWVVPGGEDT